MGLLMTDQVMLLFKSDVVFPSCFQISMTQGLWKTLTGALEGARLEDESDDFLATVGFLDLGWQDALMAVRRDNLRRKGGPTAEENEIKKELMDLVSGDLAEGEKNASTKLAAAMEVCILEDYWHTKLCITSLEVTLTPVSVQDKDVTEVEADRVAGDATPAQMNLTAHHAEGGPGRVGGRSGGRGGSLGTRQNRAPTVDPVLSKAVTGDHSKGFERVEAEVPRSKPDTKECTKGPATRSRKDKKIAK